MASTSGAGLSTLPGAGIPAAAAIQSACSAVGMYQPTRPDALLMLSTPTT